MKNFIMIGAAGYIAPRHMKAIKNTNNNLIAAYDPYDGVGIIDSFFPNAKFFVEFERFDRHVDKLIREGVKIDYLVVCSPNYLHDAHVRYGLRIGVDVICEKPLVLNSWNVDALKEIEANSKGNIYNILQLRLHPSVIELKRKILTQTNNEKHIVDLKYITSRGEWYFTSWKGDKSKSGGMCTNIGIHFFDMLQWIFGQHESILVKKISNKTFHGELKLENAEVKWLLSVDPNELPDNNGFEKRTYRSLNINNKKYEFSEGFEDLHDESYRQIINGQGFGLDEVKESIKIVTEIRNYE